VEALPPLGDLALQLCWITWLQENETLRNEETEQNSAKKKLLSLADFYITGL
jgi:hypothetical protein